MPDGEAVHAADTPGGPVRVGKVEVNEIGFTISDVPDAHNRLPLPGLALMATRVTGDGPSSLRGRESAISGCSAVENWKRWW